MRYRFIYQIDYKYDYEIDISDIKSQIEDIVIPKLKENEATNIALSLIHTIPID